MIKKNINKYRKVRDHDHYTGQFRGAAHSQCNLRYSTTKEIPIISHNGTNYDYHFITNELANRFNAKDFNCLGENMEKYITIEVPIVKINDDGELVTYDLKFIDSNRFMTTTQSDLTDNLSEICKCNCKDLNNQRIRIKREDNIIITRCKTCNKKSKKLLNTLKDEFSNVYRFCNNNDDKFILLLRKGVYPYEYIDSCQRFNEDALPLKKEFYSKLTLQDITSEDYKHAKNVWKAFNIKNIGEYHDLYVQLDTLLLSDTYKNFRNVCLGIYQFDPAHFLSASGLA